MTSYEINFCSECNNLTRLSIDENKKLMHDCKYCDKKETIEDMNGKCIYTALSKKIDKSALIKENLFIHHDITLPNLKDNNNIVCPNEKCESIKDGSSIKYIKYDNDELRYIYICNKCGIKWKISK